MACARKTVGTAAPWQATTSLKGFRALGLINSGATTSRTALGVRQGVAGNTAPSNHPPRRSATTGHNDNEPVPHDLAAHGDLERHCGAPWFS